MHGRESPACRLWQRRESGGHLGATLERLRVVHRDSEGEEVVKIALRVARKHREETS
jgi:hypothetical protein